MADRENFVARWSRLKSSPKKEASSSETDQSLDGAEMGPPSELTADDTIAAAVPTETFDIETLPSIESITLDTDIRAFLQTGVPRDLRNKALRRAWAADPAIRDFIGIAENQWDFNDPNGIPGSGPMLATDNVKALVARALGQFKKMGTSLVEFGEANDLTTKAEAQIEQPKQRPIEQASDVVAGPVATNTEPREMLDEDRSGQRKSHGGALPR